MITDKLKKLIGRGGGVKPSPALRGSVDVLSNGRLIGWACDVYDIFATVKVHLCFAGDIVQSADADIARADVNEIGVPGRHGFDFPLPPLPIVGPGDVTVIAEHRGAQTILPLDRCERDIIAFYSAYDYDEEASLVCGSASVIRDVSTEVYHAVIYVPLTLELLIDFDKTGECTIIIVI